jgi:hypothetical protein
VNRKKRYESPIVTLQQLCSLTVPSGPDASMTYIAKPGIDGQSLVEPLRLVPFQMMRLSRVMTTLSTLPSTRQLILENLEHNGYEFYIT